MRERKKRIFYPRCRHGNKNCFAYFSGGGVCMLLNNTSFPDRNGCPFYKDASKAKEARYLLREDMEEEAERWQEQ